MTADQLLRREYLGHLMAAAEVCPDYARRAARDYEKLASANSYPAMFKGLGDKFDADWSALQAQRKAHA